MEATDPEDHFLRSNRSRRLLALALVPLCIGFAACGGNDEAPETQVIVPEATAAPATTDPNTVDGYLMSATPQHIVMRTQEGDEMFRIKPRDVEALGIGHLASHAGVPSIGFRIYLQEIDGERFVKGAEEIPPPF